MSSVRRRRRLVITASILSVLIGLLAVYHLGIKRLPSTDPAELDALDRQMFAVLQEQYEQFAEHPNLLWDEDYRYDREPLILARTDSDGALAWPYVYLVNMSSLIDTSGYSRMGFPDDGVLRDVRVATDIDLQTLQLWTPGAFATLSFGGRNVLAFKYSPAQFADDGDPLLGFGPFSMHEAFHVNAQSAWGQDLESNARAFDPPRGDALRAAFADEFAALDRVTTARDGEEQWQIADEIVRARDAQLAAYPQLAPRDAVETIEGSARYLERRYSDLTGGRIGILTNRQGQSNSFSAVLEWAASRSENATVFERQVWYETGAQLGYLLDEIAPGWKERVADGQTNIMDVLAATVAAHEASPTPGG